MTLLNIARALNVAHSVSYMDNVCKFTWNDADCSECITTRATSRSTEVTQWKYLGHMSHC